MTKLGEHAVVLGASMGGLLAARVLADFYETVTVVERDVLPETSANRRGVPQGRHVHLLLGRGSQVLDELFPGFLDELVAAGAPSFDGDMSKLYLSNGGHLFPRSGRAKDVPFFLPSRPLLESHVRRRMRAVANVTVLDGHDVVELTSTPPRDRVTGALVRERPDGSERVLGADWSWTGWGGVRAHRPSWRASAMAVRSKTILACVWRIPASCCGFRPGC